MKYEIKLFVPGDRDRTPMHVDAINEMVIWLNKLINMRVMGRRGEFVISGMDMALNLTPDPNGTSERPTGEESNGGSSNNGGGDEGGGGGSITVDWEDIENIPTVVQDLSTTLEGYQTRIEALETWRIETVTPKLDEIQPLKDRIQALEDRLAGYADEALELCEPSETRTFFTKV
jgi:hypothetical protein